MRKRKVVHKCDYCEIKIGIIKFKNGKWCCGNHVMKCLEFAKQHSKAMKGKKFSEDHKKKISEANKNKIFSKETRKKMSEAAKKRCSTAEYKRKFRQINPMERPGAKEKFKKSMKEHWKSITGIERPEHSIQISGPNHPNWKGGKSYEDYCAVWCEEFREMIRERDGYVCQVCGISQNEESHSVHHIDGDKKNCDLNNMIILCRPCHTKVHRMKGDLFNNLITAITHQHRPFASPFVPAYVN